MPAGTPPAAAGPTVAAVPGPAGPLLGILAGQIVTAQVALVLPVAAAGHGPLVLGAAGLAAGLLIAAAWVRVRRRWLFEWAGLAIRYALRRRRLDPGDPGADRSAGLLDLVAPGCTPIPADQTGTGPAVLADATGLTAILELGNPDLLLTDAPLPLPSPRDLLPAVGPESPPLRVQLVLAGTPAPAVDGAGDPPAGAGSHLPAGRGGVPAGRSGLPAGGGGLPAGGGGVPAGGGGVPGGGGGHLPSGRGGGLPPVGGGLPPVDHGGQLSAVSYRQLVADRPVGYQRALVAVRVLRTGGWSDDELGRALSGAVRRVRRRLAPVPVRPLGERAALGVLGELAHHDGRRPARESWQWLAAGGLRQAAVRVDRWPQPGTDAAYRLVPRLLELPAAAVTVAIGAGPGSVAGSVPVDLTVRLTAGDAAGLTAAVRGMRRLLDAGGGSARRLDGEHLAGLRATLPLGLAPAGRGRPPAGSDALDLPMGGAGLMIGANRHGTAVGVRLFRPEPTGAVLIGGVRPAQLIALRAMALGARVVVQTTRPGAWNPFVRGAAGAGEPIPVIPAGRGLTGPPATPLRPVLTIVDVGPVAAAPARTGAWQARLVVRDEVTATDVDPLARADLVILQPLRPAEAALAGPALGLGDSADWLTRIRDDMVGLVNRRVLRWARLAVTPIEARLVGSPTRR
ncbi:type VII secretion protein EccE [Solwaraspora sp. WMMD1047]|uniref:type VII secretion protein EccE n=1 Tax=Solwaraspora sp. WMMD1047 TaxID=3016102 RepID=UPI002415EDE6|nr:type VII secretion protein EccE [Solwaraspora sp. WMMD1047]MDG4833888.1 type VII secretion protein EccE [Solwaraspora sp. WMMD1047]